MRRRSERLNAPTYILSLSICSSALRLAVSIHLSLSQELNFAAGELWTLGLSLWTRSPSMRVTIKEKRKGRRAAAEISFPQLTKALALLLFEARFLVFRDRCVQAAREMHV